jgi:hypothetical protein
MRDFTPKFLLFAELIGSDGAVVDRVSEKAPYHGAQWIAQTDWDSAMSDRAEYLERNLRKAADAFGVEYATAISGKRPI